MPKKILIIAGEASGDMHGANLIRELKKHYSEEIEIHAVGGNKMEALSPASFYDLASIHVTGFTAVIGKIPLFKKAARWILDKVQDVKPNLVVLIDNPGFNLHLCPGIHKLNVPIVYYISPQLWAWSPKRIFKIKKYVKKMLVLFEFEKALYEKHGIPVAFVGHPLKDLIQDNTEHPLPQELATKTRGKKIICLLPGSRKNEVKNLLGAYLGAARLINNQIPETTFFLVQAPTLSDQFINQLVNENTIKFGEIKNLNIIKHGYDVIRHSDLSLVCSGTATLECALLKSPMVISYKSTFLTYLIAKNLISVAYLGMPNIILSRYAFPECLQYDVTPKKLSEKALEILQNEKIKIQMKNDLDEISHKLGAGGANEKVAQEIIQILN